MSMFFVVVKFQNLDEMDFSFNIIISVASKFIKLLLSCIQ